MNKNQSLIIKELKKAKKIAFFHHNNPDGDAVGSSYALLKSIHSAYPDKELAYLGDEKSLNRSFPFVDFDKKFFRTEIDNTWTVVVGDTSTHSRIYNIDEFSKGKVKICFDHHLTKSDIDVDIIWQDHTFNASSIQSWMIATELNENISSKTALIFLMGIITDTGWFAYALNNRTPFLVAADILLRVKKDDIDKMYNAMRTKSEKSIKLQKWVLNNFVKKEKFVYCIFKDKDLIELGISPAECTNIWQIGNMENSTVWAFFVEDKKEDSFKVSLRSNGKNVGEVASKHGGGGHARAAGIRIPMDYKKLNELINELIIFSK